MSLDSTWLSKHEELASFGDVGITFIIISTSFVNDMMNEYMIMLQSSFSHIHRNLYFTQQSCKGFFPVVSNCEKFAHYCCPVESAAGTLHIHTNTRTHENGSLLITRRTQCIHRFNSQVMFNKAAQTPHLHKYSPLE